MLYPLTFHPIFKERVWGGRKLAELYGKPLPPGRTIGESWEISDRPGDVSVIANGPFAGRNLHWLMENHAADLLGPTGAAGRRFPLLVKILDAQEKLSLQVHPPAHKAAELGGEPKTEMWYVADALPGAELYVGLKRGTNRDDFARKTRDASVAECFHRIPVRQGDVMFLPSGRVHAIGAGLVIFEIQQNSDTTYRVFDWNRMGLDGKPRELHVAESLASIDFEDFEPALVPHHSRTNGAVKIRPLVIDPLFKVDAISSEDGGSMELSEKAARILGVVSGCVTIKSNGQTTSIEKGGFVLIPYATTPSAIAFDHQTTILLTETGR